MNPQTSDLELDARNSTAGSTSRGRSGGRSSARAAIDLAGSLPPAARDAVRNGAPIGGVAVVNGIGERKPAAPQLKNDAGGSGGAGGGTANNTTDDDAGNSDGDDDDVPTTLDELKEKDPDTYSKMLEEARAMIEEEDEAGNAGDGAGDGNDEEAGNAGGGDEDEANNAAATFEVLDRVISTKMPGRNDFIADCIRNKLSLDAARDKAIDTLAGAVNTQKPGTRGRGEANPLNTSGGAGATARDPLGIAEAKTYDEAMGIVMKAGKTRAEAANALNADAIGKDLRAKI